MGQPQAVRFAVTPRVREADPAGVVALAVAAEEHGLDLVLVPSGEGAPGAPAAWDDWTLLSWIAARTDSIGLATAGLDPDRGPVAVLARAAAGLDLLTDGRLTLGLAVPAPASEGVDADRGTESSGALPATATQHATGGGVATDAARAAATSLTGDAVTVLRGMWDTSRGRVRHHGPRPVMGADPGPTPAHDIPIWVAGRDADAITLAGRVADGWVTDVDPHEPQALVEDLHRLDAAAEAAGRDRHELDRVAVITVPGPAPNGPAAPERAATGPDLPEESATGPDAAGDRWVVAVADLVRTHAISTVVLRVDATDPDADLGRLAAAVLPALRQAGRDALDSGVVPARRPRRADVRARRRPGIDYDGIPDALSRNAVEPGDVAYGTVRSTYLRAGHPGLVLRPRTVAEVSDAVRYADRHRPLPLGVRSGGHGISGRSTNDGGLVIDLRALRDVEILDETRRLVRLGPGARWKEVATVLHPHGWALGSGDFGGVGVGGLTTAGGIGFLSRLHGLTVDHVVGVDLVLADGSVVRADHDTNTDLFWAVRGAGSAFGIAVGFDVVVRPTPAVGWAQLAFRVDDPARFLVDFGRVVTATPRETTPFLIMAGATAHVMAMVASDDPDVVVSQLEPLAGIAPMVRQNVVIAPYAAVMNMFPDAPHQGMGEPVSRSGLVTALTPDVAAASVRVLDSGAAHWFQIRSMGGAIGDVPADATAFAHRDAAFQITVMGTGDARVDAAWSALRPHLSGSYLSFDTSTGPHRLHDAFPPATLARLRDLKPRFDPTNLFRDNIDLVAGTDGRPT